MSKIFELFGYRLDRWSRQAEENIKRTWCPFMDAVCDGGGNRFQSAINLLDKHELKAKMPDMATVQAGVCSLQSHVGEQPWIVCPRRLLSVKGGNLSNKQASVRKQISNLCGLDNNQKHLMWSEIKIKTKSINEEEEAKHFDYTFDFVLSGTCKIRLMDAVKILDISAS